MTDVKETKKVTLQVIDTDTGEVLSVGEAYELDDKTNAELARGYTAVDFAIKHLYRTRDIYEGTLRQRMDVAETDAFLDDGILVERKTVTPDYEVGLLEPIREEFPEVWEEIIIPETTKIVPPKADGRKLRSWRSKNRIVNRYADQADKNRGRTKLSIKLPEEPA